MTSTPAAAQHLRDLARLRRVRDRIDRDYAQPLEVVTVAQRLDAGFDRDTLDTYVTSVLDGLGKTDPKLYEPALTQLGILLGAQAGKPAGRVGATPPGAGTTRCGSRSRQRAGSSRPV